MKHFRFVFVAGVALIAILLFVPRFSYAEMSEYYDDDYDAKISNILKPMTDFERAIVELGLRLLPYDHPFVLAYEKAYSVDIDSFITEINGVTLSGVPFDFGGSGHYEGFNENWWQLTNVAEYPIRGLDCAEYAVWIYYQLGYEIPAASAKLFLSGVSGVKRQMRGVREHYVIPSFDDMMIGDIAYNSETYTYASGHGSHIEIFLGTARKLGIANEIRELIPEFPVDAYLVLDCGWSDGSYYYEMMHRLNVPNPRKSMSGVGIQFFTSIKNSDGYIYESPRKVFKYTNPDTNHTFRIESRLEANRRYLQYKPSSDIEYTINVSRPIVRPDEPWPYPTEKVYGETTVYLK